MPQRSPQNMSNDRHLRRSPKLYRGGDDFLHILRREIQSHRRRSECLGTAGATLRILRPQHQGGASKRQLGMHWLAVRPVHYSAFGKAESLLIKTDGGLHIGHREHRGHGTVLFLVEWINLLRHVSPLAVAILAKPSAWLPVWIIPLGRLESSHVDITVTARK